MDDFRLESFAMMWHVDQVSRVNFLIFDYIEALVLVDVAAAAAGVVVYEDVFVAYL